MLLGKWWRELPQLLKYCSFIFQFGLALTAYVPSYVLATLVYVLSF